MDFWGRQHKFVPVESIQAEDALEVDISGKYVQIVVGCPELADDCCTLRTEDLGTVAEMVSSVSCWK